MPFKRISTNGIELQIMDSEGPGDAIVFLHFGGSNLMSWQAAIPYFEGKFRTIQVDIRGHGQSEKAMRGYHIDDMAQDVIGMLDALGIEKAHLVGSSLGAEVALSMAANHPERVRSLVCEGAFYSEYGPYGVWDGSEEEFKQYVAGFMADYCQREQKYYASVEEIMALQKAQYEEGNLWNPVVEAMVRHSIFAAPDGRFASSWRQAMREYLPLYFEYRFEDYYQRVKCPLMILPDAEDWQDERKRTIMEGFRDLCPGARITLVPEWSHPYGWMITPEGASKAVAAFITEVQG